MSSGPRALPGPSAQGAASGPRPLVHKADFERALAVQPRSRSAHFAVHHVAGAPTAPVWRHRPPAAQELSTAGDNSAEKAVDSLPRGWWIGSVVPKRHAKRAVTRNLLKRQIRAAVARHAARLPQGLWLVRLKSPFAPAQFPSAASAALRAAARAELDVLLARAA